MVSSKDPQLAALFNLTRVQYRAGSSDLRSGNINGEISGYTLDDKGTLIFLLSDIAYCRYDQEPDCHPGKKRLMEENLVNDPVVQLSL
nr:hypothetical protein [Phocaeicola vulgatus]